MPAHDLYSAVSIVKHMREFTDACQKETHLNWSTFATPAEAVAGRFATIDKNDDKQVRNNTETTVKSVKADQPKSTYIYTNGGVYAAPQKKQQ